METEALEDLLIKNSNTEGEEWDLAQAAFEEIVRRGQFPRSKDVGQFVFI